MRDTTTEQDIIRNTVDHIEFNPLTKHEILKRTMGEITVQYGSSQTKKDLNGLKRNTVYSEVLFGNKSNDKDGPKYSRGKNMAHITLRMPMVNPIYYAYTSTSQLPRILGVATNGALVSEVAKYERYIIISLDPKVTAKFNTYTDYKTEVKDIEMLVNRVIEEDDNGKPISSALKKTLIPTIKSTSSKFKELEKNDQVILLTGGYAIAYLLGTMNIKEIVRASESLNLYKPSQKDGYKPLSESLKKVILQQANLIKSIINSKSKFSLIDIITNVIPVCPAEFRDPIETVYQGVESVKEIKWNSMYDTIIQLNNEIGEILKTRDKLMPYEEVYMYSLALNGNSNTVLTPKQTNEFLLHLNNICNEQVTAKMYKLVKEFNNTTALSESSIVKDLTGKTGKWRQSLNMRTDETGRSVLSVDPNLELDTMGIPYSILITWFKKQIESDCKKNSLFEFPGCSKAEKNRKLEYLIKYLDESEEKEITVGGPSRETSLLNLESALMEDKKQKQREFIVGRLQYYVSKCAILFIRYPSLHVFNECCFRIVITFDKTIHFHPLVCACYNADFDGDTGSVWLIRTKSAVEEVRQKNFPSTKMLSSDGSPMLMLSQDSVLGNYYMTLDIDYKNTQALNNDLQERINNNSYVDLKGYNIPYFKDPREVEMAIETGKIKVHDKVIVDMPKYTNSTYMKIFKERTQIHDACTQENLNKTTEKPVDDGFVVASKKLGYNIHRGLVLENDKLYMTVSNNITEQDMSKITPETSKVAIEKNSTRPFITIAGRVVLNTYIPQDLGFVDRSKPENEYLPEIEGILTSGEGTGKGAIKKILKTCIDNYDKDTIIYQHDILKEVGFHYATISGISISLCDANPAPNKQKLIEETRKKIAEVDKDTETPAEVKKEQKINLWLKCGDKMTDDAIEHMSVYNPLKLMIDSGARGSKSQIQQLCAMRSIMNDVDGSFIEDPVLGCFSESLSENERGISARGARKGMIDRPIKTKDTGAMTREMTIGLNDMTIFTGDCGDTEGILIQKTCISQGTMDVLKNVLVGQHEINNALYPLDDPDRSDLAKSYYAMEKASNAPMICFTQGRSIAFRDEALLDFNGNLYMSLNNKEKASKVVNIYNGYIFNKFMYTYLSTNGKLSRNISDSTDKYDSTRTIETIITEFFIDSNNKVKVVYYTDGSYIEISLNDSIIYELYMRYTDGWKAYNSESLDKAVAIPGLVLTEDGTCSIQEKPIEVFEGSQLVFKESSNKPVLITDIGEKDKFVLYPYQAFIKAKHDKNESHISDSKDYDYVLAYTGEYYLDYESGKYGKKLVDDIKYSIGDTKAKFALNGVDIYTIEWSPISEHIEGRISVETLIDKKTGETIIEHNQPIKTYYVNPETRNELETGTIIATKAILSQISKNYRYGVLIRSPLSCKSPRGICSRCYGYYHHNREYAKVGTAVGITSCHTMCEKLSQGVMRTFHTGGAAAAGDITDSFVAVRDLVVSLKIPSTDIDTKLRTVGSFITDEELEYTRKNTIEKLSKLQDDTKDNVKVAIYNGREIEGLTIEDFGVLKYRVYKDISEYFLNRLNMIYHLAGDALVPIHYEVVIRQLLYEFVVYDSGDSPYVIGDSISWHKVFSANTNLVKQGKQPMLVIPRLMSLKQSASTKESPTNSIGYQDLGQKITNIATHAMPDDMLSPISSIITGNVPSVSSQLIKKADKLVTTGEHIESLKDIVEESTKDIEAKFNILKEADNMQIGINPVVNTFDDEEDVKPVEDVFVTESTEAAKFGSDNIEEPIQESIEEVETQETSEEISGNATKFGASIVEEDVEDEPEMGLDDEVEEEVKEPQKVVGTAAKFGNTKE